MSAPPSVAMPIQRVRLSSWVIVDAFLLRRAGDCGRPILGAEVGRLEPVLPGALPRPAARLHIVRVAVVGHVEWIDFLRVERVPRQGEIVHASRGWGDAAGGGAVAAVQLRNLAGAAMFFTTFGADERGRRARERLEAKCVRVIAREIDLPQRYGVTFVDDDGERTITVVGERLTLRGDDPDLPWSELERADGVYFVSGDAETVRQARKARVLVAASRSLEVLQEAGVELDAIVGSESDPGERYEPGDLDPP